MANARFNGPMASLGTPLHMVMSEGFVEISPRDLQAVRRFYDQETVVKVASGISLSRILGGGLLFTLGEKVMDGTMATIFQQLWSTFAENVMRSIWLYGFVAVGIRPHPVVKGVPFALDLQRVKVLMRRNYDGTAEYLFYNTDRAMLGAYMEPTEIHGLQVWEFQPPSWDGHLRSVVRQAMIKRSCLDHLEAAEQKAVALNSCPVVHLEDTTPPETTAIRRFENTPSVNLESQQQIVGALMDELTVAKVQAQRQDVRKFLGSSNDLSETRPRTRYLPRGYKVGRVSDAKEPGNFVFMTESYEELVGALFYVPRSTWAQFSASRSANNPDARLMFDDGQRSQKQMLSSLLTTVFRSIHEADLLAIEVTKGFLPSRAKPTSRKRKHEETSEKPRTAAAEDTDDDNHEKAQKRLKAQGYTYEKLPESSSSSKLKLDAVASTDGDTSSQGQYVLQVLLPGLPPQDTLMQLHEIGVLKQSALVETLSKIHCMPIWQFHKDKSQLPVHVSRPLELKEKQQAAKAKPKK